MPKVKTGPVKVQAGKAALVTMLIESGALSPGFHDCTLAETKRLVATNPQREKMWQNLISFISWPILTRKFSYLFISGGYLSLNEKPDDIDIVLQTREPFGPGSFKVLEPYFSVGLETILRVYSVHLHFWMENAPPGMADFRSFFQYVRPEKNHSISNFPQKGVIRIPLLVSDILEQLQEQMETEPGEGFD
jgi:hypothetical protein